MALRDLYRDWLSFAFSEKVSEPDGAQHPEGRFGHRGQTPFPQHLCCRGIAPRALPVIELSKDRKTQKRLTPWIHTLRIVLLAMLLVGLHRWTLSHSVRTGTSAPVALDANMLVERIPQFDSLESIEGNESAVRIRDVTGKSLGVVTQTSPHSDRIVGYAGPSNVLLVMDDDLVVKATHLLRCPDTVEHLQKVNVNAKFWQQFVGWKWGETATVRVDGVSGATLTSLAIAEAVAWRLSHPPAVAAADFSPVRRSLKFASAIDLEQMQRWFAHVVSVREDAEYPFLADCLDAAGQVVGQVARTGPLHDSAIGYQGPSEVYLKLGDQTESLSGKGAETLGQRIIVDAMVGESFDNQPYVNYVKQERSFWKRFRERSIGSLATLDLEAEGIDGVSGATMTSIAVAETIRDATAAWLELDRIKAAQLAAPAAAPTDSGPTRLMRFNASWTEWLTGLIAVATLFWSRMKSRGKRVPRLLWQASVLIAIGFICGNLLSMALLGGWTRGGIAWRLAPGLTTLAMVSLLAPAMFKGNPYCDHICPHGILQQWIRPSVRRTVSPRIQYALRSSAVVVIAITLLGLLVPASVNLAWLEPFDAYSSGILLSISAAVWAASLALARWSPMGYCRLACPTGKVLDYLRRDASRHRVTIIDVGLIIATVSVWAMWTSAW